jgi:hypothetical protein
VLTRLAFVVAAVAHLGPSPAHAAGADPCDNVPAAVSAYLKLNAPWVPVRISDLSPDHQTLWNEAHPGACPGVAAADFEGGGRLSYALALIRRDRRDGQEMLVFLRPRGAKLRPTTIEPPYPAGDPHVVWREPPGAAAHDSIVFEALESAAQRYSVKNGRLKKAQISD